MARARARRSGAARAVRAVSGAALLSRAARPLFQVLTCPGAGHGPAPRGRVAQCRFQCAALHRGAGESRDGARRRRPRRQPRAACRRRAADPLSQRPARVRASDDGRGSRAPGVARRGKGGRGAPPELVEGTVLLDLTYDLPTVLPKLLQPWTEVPQAAPLRVKLLIARSPHGRVTVARADAAVASVVELADGRKTLPELAREAGLRSEDLDATLAGLADLGAVRFATGS